jgi:NAD(P)-dependent dehydrogenase (short-subunit alcohol dehydrogenase family)
LEVIIVHADMANEESITTGINKIVQNFGRIDYAVNNAGVGGKLGPATEISGLDFRSTIDINLIGLWICQREEIKQMLKQEPLEHRYIRRSINRGRKDVLTDLELGRSESWGYCEYVINARSYWHVCRDPCRSILC